MANQTRIDSARESRHKKSKSDPPKLLSLSKSQSRENNDDLILTLTEAYENQRARQVGEWERLYGQNVYRAV